MSESTNTLKSIEFTWKITNYSQQKLKTGPRKGIRSQAFSVGCEDDLKFTLIFYPQGHVQSGDTKVSNEERWTSLFLQAEGSKKYINSHLIEFSIMDENGRKFYSCHIHDKIPISMGYSRFILLADIENPANNLLPDDTLTICCRVEETRLESEDCDCEEDHPADNQQLCEDFATYLDDRNADFVFKVENVNIPVHRAILKASSPVFAAMFQHDMQEKKTNETEITDVTPDAFKALLRFIYTGHCEVEMFAEQLLVAADKYDIQGLKLMCAKELGKKLTVDNAVRLLILSDLHHANDLKDDVMRFINNNAPAVMNTPSWINIPVSHQHLIGELYNTII